MSAVELASVVRALADEWCDGIIQDVARLAAPHGMGDDLLLFVQTQKGRGGLHVALGGNRARVTITRRRFSKRAFVTGPLQDRLTARLVGRRITGFEQPASDERRVAVCFSAVTDADSASTVPHGGPLRLEVELFGNRGLWLLCDQATGEILDVPRQAKAKGRSLAPGAVYAPPEVRGNPAPARSPGSAMATTPTSRFGPADVLAEVDALFSAQDRAHEADAERARLTLALDRTARRQDQRVSGLESQLRAIDDVAAIRSRADLLLAYGHGAPRGARSIRVPDPANPDATIEIPLDPSKPVHVQAEKLYDKARRYEHGRAHAEQQLADARAERARTEELRTRLVALQSADTTRGAAAPDPEALEALTQACVDAGILAEPKPARPKPSQSKESRRESREGFRRFTSASGMAIYVGRNNAQNDRLSISFARGNDLWFHVGRGYAGSHVVVRVAKNQEVDSETVLDAATLAVHFSKIRGAELSEVIHTRAKHVQKPKGLPPGRVVATQTKEIRVRLEPTRLRRLLDSAAGA